MPASMPDKRGYIVPHTHWDREWRYPLWESRAYLVRFVDELIENLENNPDYKSFLFDGQCVQIRDYLQVRPRNEGRLLGLIRSGRIQIGPWYTLPDLYPISGESIVRNLLRGRQECEKLGNWLGVGYESFGWGQPSQFPQIYKGFGIDTVIVAKNVDKSRAPKSEFAWVGADGTTVYATRLGIEARANFFMHAYLRIMTGKEYKSDEYRYEYGADGLLYHDAGDGNANDYFKLENTQHIHQELIADCVRNAWAAMDDTLLSKDRILMDGSDSTTSQPQLTQIIRMANELCDGVELIPYGLPEYVELLKSRLKLDELNQVDGELRDGPAQALTGNALMTRAPIKLRNRLAQNRLFHAAEPLSVCAALCGGGYEKHFLDTALDYLLLSHAHDSINGVTQDKTADDVLYRLNQTIEIAQAIENGACQAIVRRIDTSRCERDDILLVAFNALAHERREIAKVYIDIPQEWNVWDFALENDEGERVPVQFVSRREKWSPVCDPHARPFPFYADRHCVLFDTGTIPAGGYRIYRLIKGDRFNRKTEFWAKTRKTKGDEIALSPTRLENEYLCAQINANGTVTLTDKHTGAVSGELNFFESTGDVGDYWVYYPPYDNQTYSSKGCAAQVCLEENGPLCATVGVRLALELPRYASRPANYIRGESARSQEKVLLPIAVRYTLKKGERQLDVQLEVANTARDHRMCVAFETGIHAEFADAQGHFCVDRRNRIPLRDDEGLYYNELTTQPMQNFVDVTDGEKGVGVATDSFGEYELRRDGILACTLFRAVKNIICTEFRSAGVFPEQHGGQVQQTMVYRYALCPHAGGWAVGGLQDIAQRLNVPLKLAQISVAQSIQGDLGMKHSFFSVDSRLQLSALKLAQNGKSAIMRVYNPNGFTVAGELRLDSAVEAYATDLAEDRLEPLRVENGVTKVELGANKILTVEFVTSEAIHVF